MKSTHLEKVLFTFGGPHIIGHGKSGVMDTVTPGKIGRIPWRDVTAPLTNVEAIFSGTVQKPPCWLGSGCESICSRLYSAWSLFRNLWGTPRQTLSFLATSYFERDCFDKLWNVRLSLSLTCYLAITTTQNSRGSLKPTYFVASSKSRSELIHITSRSSKLNEHFCWSDSCYPSWYPSRSCWMNMEIYRETSSQTKGL